MCTVKLISEEPSNQGVETIEGIGGFDLRLPFLVSQPCQRNTSSQSASEAPRLVWLARRWFRMAPLGRRSFSHLCLSRPAIEDIHGFPLVLHDNEAAWWSLSVRRVSILAKQWAMER